MSAFREADVERSAVVLDAERTLRLLAKLPAPVGLEDRVKSGLRAAPPRAAVISWPFSHDGRWMHSPGVRAAAAAAIVLVVAGGGWSVYSHIQIAPLPTPLVAPQLLHGGFNSAGARRVPQTLQGPAAATPVPEAARPVIAKQNHEAGNGTVVQQKHAKPGTTKKKTQPVLQVR